MAGCAPALQTFGAWSPLADDQHGCDDRHHRHCIRDDFQVAYDEFLPFIAIGIVLWSFVSTIITEGCTGFIAAEGIIKQLPIPLFVHILRMIWRNILIFGHNVVIFPIILIAVGKPLYLTAFLAIPGILLLLVNLTWIALILALLCARYRDLAQIVASVLQVVFYLTPIMWMPRNLPKGAGLYLLDLNPMYHLLEVVRAPLLGDFPTSINWVVGCALALVGWLFAIMLYGRYKRRIAYWL